MKVKVKMQKKDSYTIEDLLELMDFLRSENGCPWDREQTHESIKHNLVEEAYEVVDTISDNNPTAMADELGDLLLQIVFHSRMAKENGDFDFDDVLKNICDKLISRHTHLFGEEAKQTKGGYGTPEKVIDLWEKNKRGEKNQKTHTQSMKEISRAYPSLVKAFKIQKKAKQAGFDWNNPEDAFKKIYEEADELKKATLYSRDDFDKAHAEEELGDLLFSVVNYSRFIGIDPETALDKANNKFIRRFEKVEDKFLNEGKNMADLPLEELDKVWNHVKHEEKNK